MSRSGASDSDERPLTAEHAARMIAAAAFKQNQTNTWELVAGIFARYMLGDVNRQKNESAANACGLGATDSESLRPDARDTSGGSGVVANGGIVKDTDLNYSTERPEYMAYSWTANAAAPQVWTQWWLNEALLWHRHVLTETDPELLETASFGTICKKLIETFSMDCFPANDDPQKAPATGSKGSSQLQDVYMATGDVATPCTLDDMAEKMSRSGTLDEVTGENEDLYDVTKRIEQEVKKGPYVVRSEVNWELDRALYLRNPSGTKLWSVLRFWITPDMNQPGYEEHVCGDTGNDVTLVDRQ